MKTKFRTFGWVLAALAVLLVGAEFFHAGAFSRLPFVNAVEVETMGGAGPAGMQPHLW